jgi:hypothetical protein
MIHTNLPIYKKGYDLLTLAADVQLNMRTAEPRQARGERHAFGVSGRTAAPGDEGA